ncbi:MAG: hypothetical protein ACNS62_01420 [Candidatus Cyclobacteriaceae bacterium M3_2C_046]
MKDKKNIWTLLILVALIVIAVIVRFNLPNNDFIDFTLGILVGLVIGKLISMLRKRNGI